MLATEDEVDGHHAVSIGRLDEEKIFLPDESRAGQIGGGAVNRGSGVQSRH